MQTYSSKEVSIDSDILPRLGKYEAMVQQAVAGGGLPQVPDHGVVVPCEAQPRWWQWDLEEAAAPK